MRAQVAGLRCARLPQADRREAAGRPDRHADARAHNHLPDADHAEGLAVSESLRAHEPHSHDHRGQTLAAISNEVVRLRSRHYGRGPTKARTVIAGDMVVVRMFDPFTRAERTLIERGRLADVRHARAVLQDELAGEFTNAIEGLTGRTVIHYFSDVRSAPDVAVDLFLLEPLNGHWGENGGN
jgi:uncharacterized protein YbcI